MKYTIFQCRWRCQHYTLGNVPNPIQLTQRERETITIRTRCQRMTGVTKSPSYLAGQTLTAVIVHAII